ncbi:MAG: hypothetical protein IJ157_04070, partial [Clostridia bacterium]|nr:hypothetical protein [Clostridia bacterium]
ADGTWLDTARESRSPPDSKEHLRNQMLFSYVYIESKQVFNEKNHPWTEKAFCDRMLAVSSKLKESDV